MENPKIKLTPEIIKQSKTLVCDCGGMLFEGGLVIKKISQFISPTGKEEMFPMEVLICKKCGKVPAELNSENMLPEEVLAKNVIKK